MDCPPFARILHYSYAKMPEYRSHRQKAHCDSLAADQTPSDPGDAQAAVDAGRLKDAVTAAPLARAPATAHGWTSQSSAVPLDLRQVHRHPRLHPAYLAHRVQEAGVPAPVPALRLPLPHQWLSLDGIVRLHWIRRIIGHIHRRRCYRQ